MAIADFLDWGFFRPRNLIPAVLALVVGVVAWFGIRPALMEDSQPPPAIQAEAPASAPAEPPPPAEPEPVYPYVLVAKRDIQSGILIVADLVEWVEWREAVDINVAVVRGAVALQAVLGAVTVRPFKGGELLAWDGLILPGSPGFITAVLAPGRRAVTVEVDRATTSANIIFPGDHVDVILVADTGQAGQAGVAAGAAAQSIVRNVRVLAVGSTIVSLGRYGRASLSSAGVIEAVTPPQGETYTLEVSPKDAARISLAANTGQLTLAIRPIFAVPAGEHVSPVWLDEVVRSPELEAPPQVQVIRGGGDNASRESVITTIATEGA